MTAGQAEYRRYLASWRWRLISALRRRIDGNQCRTCHETRWLQVHHASYRFKNRHNWFLIVPLCVMIVYLYQQIGISWVILSLFFGFYGYIREFIDTITLCDTCHGRIHEKRSIKEFAD